MNCEKNKYILSGGCSSGAFEEVTVSVPVAVRAHAKVGDVDIKCMGPACVVRDCDEPCGRPDAISRFVIRQQLRVDIPVDFHAEADVGEGHVCFASDKHCNEDRRCHEDRRCNEDRKCHEDKPGYRCF